MQWHRNQWPLVLSARQTYLPNINSGILADILHMVGSHMTSVWPLRKKANHQIVHLHVRLEWEGNLVTASACMYGSLWHVYTVCFLYMRMPLRRNHGWKKLLSTHGYAGHVCSYGEYLDESWVHVFTYYSTCEWWSHLVQADGVERTCSLHVHTCTHLFCVYFHSAHFLLKTNGLTSCWEQGFSAVNYKNKDCTLFLHFLLTIITLCNNCIHFL